MSILARLTTPHAVHVLTVDSGAYTLTTSGRDGKAISERYLTQDEAMEWIDTTVQCGGVVHERAVA